MLAATPLGELDYGISQLVGQSMPHAPAEYTFHVRPGRVVSLRAQGGTSSADFSLMVFDGAMNDSLPQKQVAYNDDASSDTKDPGVDFVVKEGAGSFRLVVVSPGTIERFVLSINIQDTEFFLDAATPGNRRRLTVYGSCMLHAAASSELSRGSQMALWDDAGSLITTSGASSGTERPELTQFVKPGSYEFGFTGDPQVSVSGSLGVTAACQPIDPLLVGRIPSSIAAGDFNQDGRIDVIVTNQVGDTLTILLGNGDGTFAARQSFSVGGRPAAVAVGYIDADDYLDVVVANKGEGSLSVLVGNGDGTFGSLPRMQLIGKPSALILADIDRDDLLDAVIASDEDRIVSIMSGNGDGTFATTRHYDVGAAVSAMAVADVDANGWLDIVMALPATGSVAVLLGGGDGVLGNLQMYGVGAQPAALAIADFDRDDALDICVSSQAEGSVAVLRGDGSGRFRRSNAVAMGFVPYAVYAADVDSDGYQDIVVANPGASGVAVCKGRGNCEFGDPQAYGAGAFTSDMVTADVNGDGVLDILAANRLGSSVSLLVGCDDGRFVGRPAAMSGDAPTDVACADLNADGRPDVVTTNLVGRSVSVVLGRGDGSFGVQRPFQVNFFPVAVGIADLNADGRLDIVTAHDVPSVDGADGVRIPRAGTVSVLLGNGDGTFANYVSWQVGVGPSSLAVADIDGDGNPDVATANRGDGTVTILFGAGDGRFDELRNYNIGGSPASLVVADEDTDGHMDMFVSDVTHSTITVLRGQAGRGFGNAGTHASAVKPTAICVQDVDADGIVDIVTANKTSLILGERDASDDSGRVSVLFGRGDGHYEAPQTYELLPYLADVRCADINGDGRLDVVAVSRIGSDVGVLFNVGGRAYAAATPFAGAVLPTALALTDINADGRTDVVTASSTTNTISALLNAGNGLISRESSPTGGIPCAISAVDLDGDMRPDIVTANYDGRSVSILYGRGGGSFEAQDEFVVGGRPAALATADINHDGLTDVVTADSVSGTITLLANLGGRRFIPGGTFAVGDFPVAIVTKDVDADGYVDVVTANAGEGAICVLFGSADGLFTERRKYHAGRAPSAIEFADVDGDGIQDMMATDYIGGAVIVLRARGQREFVEYGSFAVGQSPIALATADVTADGLADVLVVSQGSSVVTVLRGDTSGALTWAFELEAGFDPQAILVADINGDDIPDVVTANRGARNVTTFVGADGGGFARRRVLPLRSDPYAIAVAHVDGDDTLDLVTANYVDDSVAVFSGKGDGEFAVVSQATTAIRLVAVSSRTPSNAAAQPAVSDTAAGGRSGRILSISRSGELRIREGTEVDARDVLRRDGGAAVRAVSSPLAFGAVFDAKWILAGAGAARVLSIDYMRESLRIAECADGVSLSTVQVVAAAGTATPSAGGSVLARLARVICPLPSKRVDSVCDGSGYGDLNGDGYDDIVVSNIGAGTIDILLSTRDGVFDDRCWQRVAAGAGPSAAYLADVDGDGAVDLVSANQVSGDVSVRLGIKGVVGTGVFTGTSGFGRELRYRTSSLVYGCDTDPYSGRGSAIVPQKLTAIGLGDVNGDGIVDLVATSTQDRSFSILLGQRGPEGIWAGFGLPRRHASRASTMLAPVVLTDHAEVSDVALGDFDGNGISDVALLDAVGERIIVYTSSADVIYSSVPRTIPLTGVIPKSIQVYDLAGPDGAPDGILDLVVGNDFGDVLVLQGVGDGTFKSYVRADKSVALVATDVNGDGAEDFVYGNRGLDEIAVRQGASKDAKDLFAADQKQGVLGPSAVATVEETVGGRTYKNILVANGGSNQILLFRNTGSLGAGVSFERSEPFYVGTNPSALFVADVDRNGISDVVVANSGSDDISVMLGLIGTDGRWTLKAGPRLSSGGVGPAGITVGDFVTASGVKGTDGVPDIAVTNRGSSTANIISGRGGGFFNDLLPIPLQLPPNAGPGPIVNTPAGLVIANTAVGSISVFNTSTGQAGTRFEATPYDTRGFGPDSLAFVTRAGTTYLAVGNALSGTVSQFLARPGTDAFAFDRSLDLPNVTGLAYNAQGLFGASPRTTSTLSSLFAFDGQSSSDPAAQGLSIRQLVGFVALRASAVGLVAILTSSRAATTTAAKAEAAEKTAEAKPDEVEKPESADGADAAEGDKEGGKGEAPAEGVREGKDINEAVADSPLLGFFGLGQELLTNPGGLLDSLLDEAAKSRGQAVPDGEPVPAEQPSVRNGQDVNGMEEGRDTRPAADAGASKGNPQWQRVIGRWADRRTDVTCSGHEESTPWSPGARAFGLLAAPVAAIEAETVFARFGRGRAAGQAAASHTSRVVRRQRRQPPNG